MTTHSSDSVATVVPLSLAFGSGDFTIRRRRPENISVVFVCFVYTYYIYIHNASDIIDGFLIERPATGINNEATTLRLRQ
jgi:hypothetical protein